MRIKLIYCPSIFISSAFYAFSECSCKKQLQTNKQEIKQDSKCCKCCERKGGFNNGNDNDQFLVLNKNNNDVTGGEGDVKKKETKPKNNEPENTKKKTNPKNKK